MSISVGVIGSGPSGIACMAAFNEYKKKNPTCEYKLTCYEKQNVTKGLWNVTWKTGVDSNGESIHNSMYNNLWMNNPKEAVELPFYSFDEHFKRALPSYLPYTVMQNYLEGYFNFANGKEHLRLQHSVKMCEWLEDEKKFKMTVYDLEKRETYVDYHTHVIVATGHFSTPNLVEFPGFDTFEGRIVHAHDLREAREFNGQRVLLIGGRYSAEDIAMQLFKYGAEKITISYRSKPTMIGNIKEDLNQHPLLEKVEGNKCTFIDGTSEEYDSIILCTGYRHNFPFMHSDLQLKPKAINPLWMEDVWMGVVWEKNPNIFYMGMHDQVFSMPMFAAQAWFARDVILGNIKYPSAEERQKTHEEYQAKADSIAALRCFIDFQGNYIKDLAALTDFPKYDTDGACQVIEDWCNNKINDPMTFRDQIHTSVVTGTKCLPIKKTWKDNKICSYEDFFKMYPNEE